MFPGSSVPGIVYIEFGPIRKAQGAILRPFKADSGDLDAYFGPI